ncbi:hypothetical protein A2U01_0006894, partial [Trifolium medium]|nr:hypothetical protein [Trifolium medium]
MNPPCVEGSICFVRLIENRLVAVTLTCGVFEGSGQELALEWFGGAYYGGLSADRHQVFEGIRFSVERGKVWNFEVFRDRGVLELLCERLRLPYFFFFFCFVVLWISLFEVFHSASQILICFSNSSTVALRLSYEPFSADPVIVRGVCVTGKSFTAAPRWAPNVLAK